MILRSPSVAALLTALLLTACAPGKIDRHALVERNNPHVDSLAPLHSLNLGNGTFTLTLDATGLQTFPEYCSEGLPPGTYSEWGWHSAPNPQGYTQEETLEDHPLPGHPHGVYSVQLGYNQDERAQAAAAWIRSNPQRVQLGCVGFEGLQPSKIGGVDQTLDMWDGVLRSRFLVGEIPVEVESVSGGEGLDALAARIRSAQPLPVFLRFPYPTGVHTDDGSDWEADSLHTTEIVSQGRDRALLRRTLDDTVYYVAVRWSGRARFEQTGPNRFRLNPEQGSWRLSVRYSPEEAAAPSWRTAAAGARALWHDYWRHTGVVDFSRCTDPRAPLLERRVVLSQYLMRVQEAQHFPPAETGMTYNSWFGKFHLEMVMWHSFHWAQWGRPELLRRQLAWYKTALPVARGIAERQGLPGCRWMKMTDPSATEAPSDIGSYIIWQQPHPIYMAELIYRAEPSKDFLDEYADIVQETAEWMAGFVNYDPARDRYVIEGACAATESLSEDYTVNPSFELSYWHFALGVAQAWRERRGLPREERWDEILSKLSPLAESPEGIYLPAERGPGIPDYEAGTVLRVIAPPAPAGGYKDGQRGRTSAQFVPIDPNRSYASGTSTENLLAFGMLPACPLFNEETMQRTLDLAEKRWSWRWGNWSWNWPSLTMNATRLLRPEIAVRAATMDGRGELVLPSGNNYRSETLRMYLPGNGGLLLAVGMMCAGWDGCEVENPGFPKDGTWDVRWEGIKPMP